MERATVFTRSLQDTMRQYRVDGPMCYIGAKAQKMNAEEVAKHRASFPLFSNKEMLGLDIEDGLNVDVVADLCNPALFAEKPQLRGHFGFVLCSALLEHVVNPFDAARNIQALLRPGGHLYFAGPWVWGFHPYPNDYWRISISGLKVLFPGIDFVEWWYSSTTKNMCVRIDDPKNERAAFQELGMELKNHGKHITDRAMPYLNVCAIGVRAT